MDLCATEPPSPSESRRHVQPITRAGTCATLQIACRAAETVAPAYSLRISRRAAGCAPNRRRGSPDLTEGARNTVGDLSWQAACHPRVLGQRRCISCAGIENCASLLERRRLKVDGRISGGITPDFQRIGDARPFEMASRPTTSRDLGHIGRGSTMLATRTSCRRNERCRAAMVRQLDAHRPHASPCPPLWHAPAWPRNRRGPI